MTKEEIKGKRQQIEGEVREVVGKALDDKSEEIHGKAEKAEGKIREEVGKAARKVKERED